MSWSRSNISREEDGESLTKGRWRRDCTTRVLSCEQESGFHPHWPGWHQIRRFLSTICEMQLDKSAQNYVIWNQIHLRASSNETFVLGGELKSTVFRAEKKIISLGGLKGEWWMLTLVASYKHQHPGILRQKVPPTQRIAQILGIGVFTLITINGYY